MPCQNSSCHTYLRIHQHVVAGQAVPTPMPQSGSKWQQGGLLQFLPLPPLAIARKSPANYPSRATPPSQPAAYSSTNSNSPLCTVSLSSSEKALSTVPSDAPLNASFSTHRYSSRSLFGSCQRTLNASWQVVRKEAGLEDVRLHDLRHSFASRALALGESLPLTRQAPRSHTGADNRPPRPPRAKLGQGRRREDRGQPRGRHGHATGCLCCSMIYATPLSPL